VSNFPADDTEHLRFRGPPAKAPSPVGARLHVGCTCRRLRVLGARRARHRPSGAGLGTGHRGGEGHDGSGGRPGKG
jgi:hypothetical protein